jgi:hypothetical protein
VVGKPLKYFNTSAGQSPANAVATLFWYKDNHNATLSIPDHKEVAQGTLRGLIRVAGLSVEEFIDVSRHL